MKDRVLILDDEPSIVDVLDQCLADEGYDCTATTSALTALGHIGKGGFSLLLTDLKMPEMHGLEVARRARELDPDIAIIVVTALVEVSNVVQAMRGGADDYVLKPFNLNEIAFCVSKALEKRSLVIQNRRHQEELEIGIREATAHLEQINQELRATKQYLENLLHSTVDAIITSDMEGNISFVNEGAIKMLGHTREELVGAPEGLFCVGGEEEYRLIRRLLEECAPVQNYETELRHKNGGLVPVIMSISFVRGADGVIASTLAICKDITQQKVLERELKQLSISDSLTGLYNQRFFYERLAAEIERARRQKHALSLLLFDVDRFKQYNDQHGHLAGDRALQAVGQVVLASTREYVDVGFRYGGDEFTVILAEADENQAYAVAERIRRDFEARKLDRLTLSIGVMTYRQGYSLRSFIQFADAMMYDAKRSGGNRVYVYRPEIHVILEEQRL